MIKSMMTLAGIGVCFRVCGGEGVYMLCESGRHGGGGQGKGRR